MAKGQQEQSTAIIAAARITRIQIKIKGTAILVQNKFSHKQRTKMMADMATPKSQKKSKTERPPRNYDEDFIQAQHISSDGWVGVPCAAFRTAMIDACRTVGVVMTRAKMAAFIVPDGLDADDGTPLVRIIGGPPERREDLVRNDNGGADIRVRPMFREWSAVVTVDFDEDMITADSVVNLLDRAGRQVGIGEGRPFSKDSVGQGWGTFTVVTEEK